MGFQAAGTRGRSLLDGATHIRMFGHELPVRARVESFDGLSAHAGQSEILGWLEGFETPPTQTFIVHGEPHASEALREKITERLGWRVSIPAEGDTVNLNELVESGRSTS